MPVYIDGKEVGVVVNTDKMHNGKYWIKVIDYDGTILKEDWLDTGDTFTLPTEPPAHDRLTFQEWTSPVDIVDGQITVEDSDITIGATYITTSGNDEFDIELNTKTGLDVFIYFSPRNNSNGMITVYWGDGTSNQYNVTSSSGINVSHTYSIEGNYTIEVNTTGQVYWHYGNNSAPIQNKLYGDIIYCKNIRLGISHYDANNSDRICYNLAHNQYLLETITIPHYNLSWTLYSNAFTYCPNLKGLVLPNGVTGANGLAVSYLYNLENIVLPKTFTEISSTFLSQSNNLQSIFYPKGLKNMGTSIFAIISSAQKIKNLYLQNTHFTNFNNLQDLPNLEYISLPSSLEKLASQVGQHLYNLKELDLSKCVNLTEMGNDCFANCYNLKNVILPDSFEKSSTGVFNSCPALNGNSYDSAIYLGSPSNQYLLLYKCQIDTEACNINENCKIINYYAFYSNNSLKNITIPTNIKQTCPSAFYSCYNMLSVTYEGQAPDIENQTFYICRSVEKYDFRNCSEVPALYSVTSLGHATGCQIIIPDALYDEWTTATNWVSLTNVVWVKASEVSE